MAQILSIYRLVASVIISGDLDPRMPLHKGFLQLGAGVSAGLCGLAAGFAIGVVGDAGGKCGMHGMHDDDDGPGGGGEEEEEEEEEEKT